MNIFLHVVYVYEKSKDNSVQPLHIIAIDRGEKYHIACEGRPEVYLRLKNKAFKKLGGMVKNSISAVNTLLDIKDDINDRINILVYFKSRRWSSYGRMNIPC